MNEQLEKTDAQPAVPHPAQGATKSKRFVGRAQRGHGGASSPQAVAPATPAEDDDDDGFFARHRTKIIVAAVLLLGGGAAFFVKPGKGAAPKAPERMVTISLPPPLPPPPPPPPKIQPPPPPQQQKMVEQAPVEADKPKDEPAKPKDEPPAAALGTGIKGDGPGMSGLGGSGNGGGFGGPKSGGGGSKWGFFAGQVQSKVAAGLRSNSRTKSASLDKIKVRIWADTTGRVTRAQLDTKTGDSKLDSAIQDEVLNNLQLPEPPPAGMPMPIVMRLTARRP